MTYLFTGQPGSGKTTLAKKLQMWLQTDKKNWSHTWHNKLYVYFKVSWKPSK